MPTKASQPTFVFNENDMHSNNKTVDKANKGDNCDTTDDKNDETNEDSFYGMTV